MKFTIEREILLNAISKIQGIIEKRSTMPILSNTLIKAIEERVDVIATDLEICLKASYDAEIEEEGSVSVPAKKIFEIVRESIGKKVEIKSCENYWIEINSGNSYFKVVGVNPDDYPSLPIFEIENFIKLKPGSIKKMIDSTIFVIPNEDIRAGMTGALVENIEKGGKKYLRMVTTDGHRLNYSDEVLEDDSDVGVGKNTIIPKKGLMELRKLLEDDVDELLMGFSKGAVVFKINSKVLLMRLIDGTFPEYRDAIPGEDKFKVIANRAEMMGAIKRVSIMSEYGSRAVKISIESGKLELSTENYELGVADDEIPIEYDGDKFNIKFNAQYLIETLNAFSENKFVLWLIDESRAGIITNIDNDDFFSLIMPIRL